MAIYTVSLKPVQGYDVKKIVEVQEGDWTNFQLTGENWKTITEKTQVGWYLVNEKLMSPEDFDKVKDDYKTVGPAVTPQSFWAKLDPSNLTKE